MSRRHAASLRRQPAAARQRGVALISAIFMLLLFAALAGYMVSLTTTSNITSAQDVQGARAYQAAQAGLEWGLYQVLDPANVTVVAPGAATWPNMPPCPADKALNIAGFAVTVQCARFPTGAAGAAGPPVYPEAGGRVSVIVYQITATAIAAAPSGAIERQVVVSASKCRTLDGVAPAYQCQ